MALPADKVLTCDITVKTDGVKLLTFALPSTAEHNSESISEVKLDPSESNRQIDLAKHGDTIVMYWVRNLSGVDATVGIRRATMVAPVADNLATLAANGGLMLVVHDTGEAPGILYLSNPDAVNDCLLEVGVIGIFSA
jgi:hypothetical protein